MFCTGLSSAIHAYSLTVRMQALCIVYGHCQGDMTNWTVTDVAIISCVITFIACRIYCAEPAGMKKKKRRELMQLRFPAVAELIRWR